MTNQGRGQVTKVEAYIFVLVISCLLTINGVQCIGQTVFDVTKFGAKADGRTDSAMAFIKAWATACHTVGPTKVLIPKGQFVASEVVFAGPCLAQKPMVIEIQGNVLAYDDLSSYSGGAWIMVQRVNGVIITGGGTINGRGKAAWPYNSQGGPSLPVSLVLQTVQNAQLNFLNFVDSMGFHVKVTDSNDVTVSNLKIQAPVDSPNTDGIHLSSNVNVKITDTFIGTGDDCVSVGHGNHNILVARITCGPGHGLSVGSLGKRPDETDLQVVTIINCTLTGTTNGARIKTYRQSPKLSASTIYFENIVMNNVANPIIIDQNYASKKKRQASNVRLSDIHFRNIRGTTISPVAVSLNCSSTYPCMGIELSNIDLRPIGRMAPLTSACSNAKIFVKGNLNPSPTRCI
ncbi:hypothetical protein CASFOL_029550 [Castilleja foliolosa]|uniref:Uncharacterized protein n=1 Tax=Castilleja foliolosa TaxID=1961234 RepID=A0ABD3C889_9LAMI